MPTLDVALQSLRALAQQRLPALLAPVFQEADDALFDFAQRSASSIEQQPYFDAMRELRRERARVQQAFVQTLNERFGALDAAAEVTATPSTLCLLDTDALEEQLACEQVASSAERRHAELLRQVLARLRCIDHRQQLPAQGPAWAAQCSTAFRAALASLQAPLPARLVLYKLFERRLTVAFGELLTLFDAHLKQLGLTQTRLRAQTPARPARAPEALAGIGDVEPLAAPSASAPPAWTPAGVPHAYEQIAPFPHPGPAGGADDGGSDFDHGLLAAMREAYGHLQRRRPARTGATRALDRRVALDALNRLQVETPRHIFEVLDDPQATLADVLGRELLAQARGLGMSADAGLTEQDSQALSLVGMLFDVLLSQRSYRRDVREQFLRLSVPYAKAALLDPRLFALKTHPARRLLDALAEAGDGNRGESAGERELLGRIETVIERLQREFNEDIAIFAELEAEFRQALEQHRLRLQLAERRAAETQSGRERLEHARALAASILAELVGDTPLPDTALGQFLREPWTHQLTMLALRDGEHGEAFAAARRLGQRLWAGEHSDELRRGVAQALQGNGLHEAAAELAAADILGCGREAMTVAARPIVFHAPTAPAAPPPAPAPASQAEPPAVPDDVACSPALAQARAELAALQVGDWVDFVDEDGSTPAKLSWISPISSRLLFVNRRGMRHSMASLDELAAMRVEGRLALRGDDSAFVRAMHQVLGRLREAPDAGGQA